MFCEFDYSAPGHLHFFTPRFQVISWKLALGILKPRFSLMSTSDVSEILQICRLRHRGLGLNRNHRKCCAEQSQNYVFISCCPSLRRIKSPIY
jgi:hypothetical protein